MSDGTRDRTSRQGRPRRNPTISRRIGSNIKRAREAKGYTQAYLAQLIEEPYSGAQSVSRWERGANRPDDEKLERLAEALGVSGIAWFFEIREEEAA